jgi:hypothetical protein
MPSRIDNYKILYTIGKGGFGEVKYAEDKKRQEVAIKVFYMTGHPQEDE